MKLIEKNQLFTELTTEESAAVNGGFGYYASYVAYDVYYGYYIAYYWVDIVSEPIVATNWLP